MPLTLPPDGTAAYYGPLTLHWTAGDMLDARLPLPQEFVNVLSDSELEALSSIVDQAVAAAYPALRVMRFTEWAPSVPVATSEVVVQEGGGA
jgi:hypothetical protein